MAWSEMNQVMEQHFGDLEPHQTAELLNAFVDREYFRGGGIGRKLFERICQEASSNGKKFLVLNSGPRYMRSWGFYDVMCDQDRGNIADLYGPGRDAKTWIKSL
jgi:N-acetylglutamate synthase-like GNAT family acetyltransferase